MPLLEKMTQGAAAMPLWLDDSQYATQRLAGGAAPWSEVAAYVAWRRQAQSLLRSDVITFPLPDAILAWMELNPAAIGGLPRKRPLQWLKMLLAEKGMRTFLVEYVGALRGSWPAMPLVLSCPLPARLAQILLDRGFGAGADVTDDDADSASVYLADLLREFGSTGVDGLLLGELEDVHRDGPAESFCQPLINVSMHYHWSAGRFLSNGPRDRDLAFTVSTASNVDPAAGVVVEQGFWTGDAPPSGGRFRFAAVPLDLAPEAVLARLEALRQ